MKPAQIHLYICCNYNSCNQSTKDYSWSKKFLNKRVRAKYEIERERALIHSYVQSQKERKKSLISCRVLVTIIHVIIVVISVCL